MNKSFLVGNITKDLESGSGEKAWARFTVACNNGKDKPADFIPVAVFGQLAELCVKYLKKGSKVGVEGRNTLSEYTNKDGKKSKNYSVIADRVEFLSTVEPKEEARQVQANLSEVAVENGDMPF